MGSHNYQLDTPPRVHNVFPSRLLRPVKKTILPGQVVADPQPPALLVDGEREYKVDEILDEKRGRGRGGPSQYLVKWTGYAKPTWEPASALQETVALARWEDRLRAGHQPIGRRRDHNLTQKGRPKKGRGG
jgi:hypothetical protein